MSESLKAIVYSFKLGVIKTFSRSNDPLYRNDRNVSKFDALIF